MARMSGQRLRLETEGGRRAAADQLPPGPGVLQPASGQLSWPGSSGANVVSGTCLGHCEECGIQ